MTVSDAPVRERRPSTPLTQLRSTDVLDVVPRLTLLLVVATGDPTSTGLLLGAVLLAAAILFRPLYQSPFLWIGLTGLLLSRHLPDWEGVDNHDWLLAYWCASLACALLSRDPQRVLRREAQVLVGLVFALALLWKLRSGQYIDGSFFQHSILADPRFEPVARWIGGLSKAEYTQNLVLLNELSGGGPSIRLVTTGRIEAAALVITWWGLLLEAAIAASFLVSPSSRLGRLRHVSVAIFCATTYVVVPVIGFGMLLVLMGYATTSDDESGSRKLYSVLFVLLLLWPALWRAITGVSA